MKHPIEITYTDSFCTEDIRNDVAGGMVRVTDILNAHLAQYGIDIIYVNVSDAESNPDGVIGNFRIRAATME